MTMQETPIETWANIENVLAPYIPIPLMRSLRGWYFGAGPELGPEAAVKILMACIGIDSKGVFFNMADASPEDRQLIGEKVPLPERLANVTPFPRKEGSDARS